MVRGMGMIDVVHMQREPLGEQKSHGKHDSPWEGKSYVFSVVAVHTPIIGGSVWAFLSPIN